MSEVKGHTGTILFDGTYITIRRSGMLARMSVGKGEKRIPVASVSAVQWKPAGALTNGYIEFSIAGGNEMRSKFGSATTSAVNNENAVLFTKKQMPEFEALRGEIEAAIAGFHGHTASPQADNSVATLISQLNDLKQKGLLTEQEYAAKKAELLKRM